MDNFRNAVCYDGSGTTCTIIDVIPLRDGTLRDRMLPWRQLPVRLVLQSGPDLSLAAVRVRLLSILVGRPARHGLSRSGGRGLFLVFDGSRVPMEGTPDYRALRTLKRGADRRRVQRVAGVTISFPANPSAPHCRAWR